MTSARWLGVWWACCSLLLVLATGPLWWGGSSFPQVPFVAALHTAPPLVDRVLTNTWLVALVVLLASSPWGAASRAEQFYPWVWRLGAGIIVACFFSLVVLNQHRMQPWAWQFGLVGLLLACCRVRVALATWRAVVIAIYAWSAWSRLDVSFTEQLGPWLWDGVLQGCGWSAGLANVPPRFHTALSLTIPLIELVAAFLLISHTTRRMGLMLAIAMHVVLLIGLGPRGHHHEIGVLYWNLFFIGQNILLFAFSEPTRPPGSLTVTGERYFLEELARWSVLLVSCVWPVLADAGYCDHWPAWEVYSARPEQVTIWISGATAKELPASLQPYLDDETSTGERRLRLDRWSLAELHAPLLPQPRFQLGVALSVLESAPEMDGRATVESPPNRRTGTRITQEFIGRPGIEQALRAYRCYGRPRPTTGSKTVAPSDPEM